MSTELPAGINIVLVSPNLKARNALIRAIQETSGIRPVAKKNTVSAMRAHYAAAQTRAIINTAAPEMHMKLGKHCVCPAIEVEDPTAAAMRAREIFEGAGFMATVHTHAEPEFPEGFITFVSVPALRGIALLFWPKNPDPKVLETLDKPEPWTDEDLK